MSTDDIELRPLAVNSSGIDNLYILELINLISIDKWIF